jgi:signal transduction histidine kinase/ActR/RegA family two-component response regulator
VSYTLIQPLQLYLVIPKAIEAILYLLVINQIWQHAPKIKWKDRPLVFRFFLGGMCGWFLYISLDIVIYLIAPLSMGNVVPPAFFSGYSIEYPSLLWANILRDIGFLGASIILWCYIFCAIIIRYGEVKTVNYISNNKSIVVGIIILTLFFIGYDNIGVKINDNGISVNAIFNGVSGFSLFLYITLYMISAILLYRAIVTEKNALDPVIPNREIRYIGFAFFLMGLGNFYWIFFGILQLTNPEMFTENNIILIHFIGHGFWTLSPILIYKGLQVPMKIGPKRSDYGEAGVQQFRSYVEQSLLALFIVQNGKIIHTNSYFAQLMEIPKEILDTWSFDHFLDRIYLDDAIMVLEHLGKRTQPGEMGGFITYRIHTGVNYNDHNPRIKWIQHFSNVISYRGDSMIQNILLDITDQKNLEEKYKISEIRQQKLESLALLAGGIAHDFNNLLNVLTGNLSLLRLSCESEKDQNPVCKEVYEILPDMENACQHAMKLTNQLLTFSKGGAPIKKPTALSNILDQSVKLSLSGSKAKCILQIEENLPAVDVDPNQIIQVFNNILLNADQAMPNGGIITINASLITLDELNSLSNHKSHPETTLHPGSYVKVAITDTGIGIPKELVPRIFDPYFTTKVKGTGMGLTTCLSILKRHGGAITFDSEVDKGTTFELYLPISNKSPIVGEITPHSNIKGDGRVLIMDDNESILRALSRMLNMLGFQVETAINGDEAIEKYRNAFRQKQPYIAIILDLIIPGGLGGKDTLLEIQKIDPEVIAIVSSGYSNDPIMANFKEFGFSGVLSKPYSIERLKNTLAHCLNIDISK